MTKADLGEIESSPGTADVIAKKFKSDAFEAIHSAVSGIWEVGTISKETMLHFDEACLPLPAEPEPKLETEQIEPSKRK